MKGGTISGLLGWHVDRLYRSMRDPERLIDVVEVAGVRFQTVNSGTIDLTNAAGKMVVRILGSVARQESEHHAKVAKQGAAVTGEWCASGSRPFGCNKIGVPLEPEVTARLPRTSCPAAACTPSPESGISGASPRCGSNLMTGRTVRPPRHNDKDTSLTIAPSDAQEFNDATSNRTNSVMVACIAGCLHGAVASGAGGGLPGEANAHC